MSELENKGGWAAVVNVDANMADFATVSATGSMSTIGFGSLEQGPNQRSLEDQQQYDVVTNLNLGQLLPQNWGIQLPFNYGRSEELITPKYDPQYQDIELQSRLDNAASEEDRERIKSQSIDYTRRQSVNFIGARKEKTGGGQPRIYDVDELTAAFSYHLTAHHNYQVEESVDERATVGATYNYHPQARPSEPPITDRSISAGRYWQFLEDLNISSLPTSVSRMS